MTRVAANNVALAVPAICQLDDKVCPVNDAEGSSAAYPPVIRNRMFHCFASILTLRA